MCGVTGAILKEEGKKYFELLKVSEIRGQDGTGVVVLNRNDPQFFFYRSNLKASEEPYFSNCVLGKDEIVIGQNRLAIFGLDHYNDQPLITDRFALVHNGNLYDFEKVFEEELLPREYQVDTELILRLIEKYNPQDEIELGKAIAKMMERVKGNMACLLLDKKLNRLAAFRRDKPLWKAEDETGIYFFSTDRIGKKLFQILEELPNNFIDIY